MKKYRFYKYKNIILLSVLLFLSAAASLYLTRNIKVLIPQMLLSIFLIYFIHQEKKACKKELEKVSDAIQSMIDGRKVQLVSDTAESLTSKIQHQLNRLEAKHQGYDKMLSEAQGSIRMLITEIAHQLRTPLVNIETYLDLLNRPGLLPEEQNQYLTAVLISEKKLAFLIQSFIKMSRFENHLIQIKKESDNFHQTVLNAIFQVHKKAEEKNINITLHDKERFKVWHDPNWLGEAVYNILENSVKYSPKNSEIEIALMQNEMFTRLSVRDYGMGIQNGEENQIFKRFYRGMGVTTEEGFGIGLYLSREIVSRHNGFIKVKREDTGLTIFLYLPQ